MKLTIAICTWNRETSLRETLFSIQNALPPRHSDWEMIIVNNNCTDGTDAVVHQFLNLLPIRLIHEPRPGVSNARNSAIDAASGEYIIWTDDDVRVGRNWLVEYEQAFIDWPMSSVFGGAVTPLFEEPSPSWLPGALPLVSSAFAVRSLDSGAAPVLPDNLPYGANFAVRVQEQRRFRYKPELGLRPGKLIITDEETGVIHAILAEGGSGRWLPSAPVQHWIPRSRQTIAYLRAYYKGQGWMYGVKLKGNQRSANSGSKSRLLFRALFMEMRYRLYRLSRKPPVWVPALKRAASAWGRVMACK